MNESIEYNECRFSSAYAVASTDTVTSRGAIKLQVKHYAEDRKSLGVKKLQAVKQQAMTSVARILPPHLHQLLAGSEENSWRYRHRDASILLEVWRMKMRRTAIFASIFALALCATTFFVTARGTAAQDHGMKIDLSGGAEVPGPGDTDGAGTVGLTVNAGKSEICYDITVKGIQAPTAAHIHAGPAGSSGAVKVAFKKAADGSWKGCVAVDKAILDDIMKNPGNYYVNVHTSEFPNGAIRGQLGK